MLLERRGKLLRGGLHEVHSCDTVSAKGAKVNACVNYLQGWLVGWGIRAWPPPGLFVRVCQVVVRRLDIPLAQPLVVRPVLVLARASRSCGFPSAPMPFAIAVSRLPGAGIRRYSRPSAMSLPRERFPPVPAGEHIKIQLFELAIGADPVRERVPVERPAGARQCAHRVLRVSTSCGKSTVKSTRSSRNSTAAPSFA